MRVALGFSLARYLSGMRQATEFYYIVRQACKNILAKLFLVRSRQGVIFLGVIM